ncbi:hypothetical protein [Methanogenium cariaci]|uniref:hypothetical protein n=1 Tax=Methanogenium cariaci TaxID=2197 RepID=UPI0012F68835|nr:hypothetical protein [Methanogenium cariaci]
MPDRADSPLFWGAVSAYEIKCSCPDEVYRGDIVTIGGDKHSSSGIQHLDTAV